MVPDVVWPSKKVKQVHLQLTSYSKDLNLITTKLKNEAIQAIKTSNCQKILISAKTEDWILSPYKKGLKYSFSDQDTEL